MFWFFRRFDPELLHASEHCTRSCTCIVLCACTIHTVFVSELISSPSYLIKTKTSTFFLEYMYTIGLKLLVLDQFIKTEKKN